MLYQDQVLTHYMLDACQPAARADPSPEPVVAVLYCDGRGFTVVALRDSGQQLPFQVAHSGVRPKSVKTRSVRASILAQNIADLEVLNEVLQIVLTIDFVFAMGTTLFNFY